LTAAVAAALTPPLRFGAGVYFSRLSEPLKAAVKDYALDGSWECDVDDLEPWLWRFIEIDDLLNLVNLEAQVAELQKFALDTFGTLHDSPPDPRDPQRKL
jgi:hypothetical protein